MEHVETIRSNIRDFKAANGLDKVIVLWTANTERFAEVSKGVNTTSAELMDSIRKVIAFSFRLGLSWQGDFFLRDILKSPPPQSMLLPPRLKAAPTSMGPRKTHSSPASVNSPKKKE